MIINSSSERLISNSKHEKKDRLRTPIDGDKLNQLAKMSSESYILRKHNR